MAESIYRFLMQDALSTGGGQDDALKDKKGDMENEENRRTNKKSLQQRVGIQLTLAAILKQSSIFTGFIGSLFQIVGAFVDTLLMGVFPLLKGGLKFIMKFFDPIKKAGAGIGTIVEFVMKIFSNMPKLPGRDIMDLPGEIGNPLLNLQQIPDSSRFSFLKKIPGAKFLGRGLVGLDILSGFGEDNNVDRTVEVTQGIIGALISSTIVGAGISAAPFTKGLSIPASLALAYEYEKRAMPKLDEMVEDIIYSITGRREQDIAYSTAPAD